MITNSIKNFALISAFTLSLSIGNFNCGTSQTQVTEPEKIIEEKVTEETTTVAKRNSILPVSGCCPLNKISQEIVVLDRICFSDTTTELVLKIKERKKVCVLQEGTVFQDDKGKQYNLLKTKDVDFCPKRKSILNTEFSIFFEKMDPTAISFDYKESATAKHAFNPWRFEAVDLTHCSSPTE